MRWWENGWAVYESRFSRLFPHFSMHDSIWGCLDRQKKRKAFAWNVILELCRKVGEPQGAGSLHSGLGHFFGGRREILLNDFTYLVWE